MLLKRSTKKTKKFLHKSLQSLTSCLFCKYKNIPKTLILSSLSNSSIHNSHILDQLSLSNSERLEFPESNTTKTDTTTTTITTPSETNNKPDMALCGATKEELSFQEDNESKSFRLAQKMKVLEMMNGSDLDHSLDVEEALHYYARLTCPVYVDIVDKFFMDMYRDYYFPQLSISLGSMSRRLGSSRRFGSSQKLSSSCRLGSSRRLGSSLRLSPVVL